MGIHLLCCIRGNKCMETHDAVCNTFATIVWDAGFHMGWKQLHALPSTTFKFSHWQVNIVFTKADICILIDIIIANPMWTNLFPQSCAIQELKIFNVAQAKERRYRDQHLIDQFFPWAIEIFEYLHKQADVFLHDRANAIWSLKGPKGLIFLSWFFFGSKTFNHIIKDASTIHVKLGNSYRPSYFLTSTPSRHTSHHHGRPIASGGFLTWRNMANLLQAVSFWHGEILTSILS